MREVEFLVGIYNHFSANPEVKSNAAFYFIYLLDDKGLMDLAIPERLYNERFKSELTSGDMAPGLIGPFNSIESLNQYAFLLCEGFNADKISLLSVQEYNSLLEVTHTATDFYRDLLEKGNVMKNIERKKKGFLRRFF